MKETFYLFGPTSDGLIRVSTIKTATSNSYPRCIERQSMFFSDDGSGHLRDCFADIRKGDRYFSHVAWFDSDRKTHEPGLWNVHYDGCDYFCEGLDGCKKKLIEIYDKYDDSDNRYVRVDEAEWIDLTNVKNL